MKIKHIIIVATRQVLPRLHDAAAPALVNRCTSPTGKVILVPVLVALGLCLGACTDEPSENEMADAVNRAVSQVYDAAYARNRPIPGPMPVVGLRKIDCDKAKPKPGYVCNFEPFVNGTAKPQESGRFYKGTDGIMTYSQF